MTIEAAIFLLACGAFIFGPGLLILFGREVRGITCTVLLILAIYAGGIFIFYLILPFGVLSNPSMAPLFTLWGIISGCGGMWIGHISGMWRM